MNNISFPNLGISLNINPVAFTVFSRPVHWYALIILTGFLLAALFVTATCEKRGIKKENVWDVALYGLVAGIIGARIYYVLFALDEFNSFWEMLQIWNGGLAIYGGIIGAVISTAIYCRIKKLNMFAMFDIACPGLFIGQAIGRFGNFVNAEVYGGETSSLFGMSINGAPPVHPLFLYEAVWNAIGLVILLLIRDKKKADGQVFCFYLMWYSIGRFFLEGMRNPAYILYVIPGKLGISQLVAVVLVIVTGIGAVVLQKRAKKAAAAEATEES